MVIRETVQLGVNTRRFEQGIDRAERHLDSLRRSAGRLRLGGGAVAGGVVGGVVGAAGISTIEEILGRVLSRLENSPALRTLSQIGTQILDALAPVVESILPAISAFLRPLVPVFEVLSRLARQIGPQLTVLGGLLGSTLAQILEPLLRALAPLLPNILDALILIARVLGLLLPPLLRTILPIVERVVALLNTIFNTFFKDLDEQFQRLNDLEVTPVINAVIDNTLQTLLDRLAQPRILLDIIFQYSNIRARALSALLEGLERTIGINIDLSGTFDSLVGLERRLLALGKNIIVNVIPRLATSAANRVRDFLANLSLDRVVSFVVSLVRSGIDFVRRTLAQLAESRIVRFVINLVSAAAEHSINLLTRARTLVINVSLDAFGLQATIDRLAADRKLDIIPELNSRGLRAVTSFLQNIAEIITVFINPVLGPGVARITRTLTTLASARTVEFIVRLAQNPLRLLQSILRSLGLPIHPEVVVRLAQAAFGAVRALLRSLGNNILVQIIVRLAQTAFNAVRAVLRSLSNNIVVQLVIRILQTAYNAVRAVLQDISRGRILTIDLRVVGRNLLNQIENQINRIINLINRIPRVNIPLSGGGSGGGGGGSGGGSGGGGSQQPSRNNDYRFGNFLDRFRIGARDADRGYDNVEFLYNGRRYVGNFRAFDGPGLLLARTLTRHATEAGFDHVRESIARRFLASLGSSVRTNLQLGGIVPTERVARIAEAGPEAVLPLGDLARLFREMNVGNRQAGPINNFFGPVLQPSVSSRQAGNQALSNPLIQT